MWYYEGDPSEKDRKLESALQKLFGNERVSHGFSRFFSLYDYLREHPPTNPQILQKTVYLDKAGILPFFDESSSQKVCQMWKIVHDPKRYGGYLRQRFSGKKTGGAITSTEQEQLLDKAVNWSIQKAKESVGSLGFTPESPGIRGTIANVGSYGIWIASLPMKVFSWIVDNPYLKGGAWEDALDLFLKIAPKLMFTVEESGNILSIPLMPVFGLGFVVEAIAATITTFLGLTSGFLSLALGKPGSAFLSFLGVIPMVGSLLRVGVTNTLGIYTDIL